MTSVFVVFTLKVEIKTALAELVTEAMTACLDWGTDNK